MSTTVSPVHSTNDATAEFPTPTARPAATIVVFDGQCRFCRGSVQRLKRLDLFGQLAYLSLHDPEVQRRWPDLRHDDLMRNMLVVEPNGQRYWGAAAFRCLTRRLPALWPLAPLLHIPFSLPVWQRLYQFVAQRRYLFGRVESCDSGSCHIPR
ncbi:MAG TPA: DUF393 domain-containing protein [Pirellulales bacterium]|nr:DUF393 domain-containing protein [Pirellulales bacterium]